MNRALRTEGAVLLARTGLSQPEIAAAVGGGCRQGTVAKWMNGDRVPRPIARRKLERLYKIDRKTWERQPSKTSVHAPDVVAASKPDSSPTLAPEDVSVFDLAVQLQREVEAQTARARGAQLTAAERMRVLSEAARILTILGNYTGARMTVEERKIVRTKAWRNIEDAIAAALAPFPAAAKAVGEALVTLGQQGEHTP